MIPFWAATIIQAILESAVENPPSQQNESPQIQEQEQPQFGYPPPFSKNKQARRGALITGGINQCDVPNQYNQSVNNPQGYPDVSNMTLQYQYIGQECFVKASFAMTNGETQTYTKTTGKGKIIVKDQSWGVPNNK